MLLIKVVNERYLKRNIAQETQRQYGGLLAKEEFAWPPYNADLRRGFYLNHAVTPSERQQGRKPRDIWMEGASHFDELKGGRIYDLGTSSGYFMQQLLDRGHRGELIGVDTADSHLQLLEGRLRNDYDHPAIWLKKGDAGKLKDVPSSSADGASGLFLAYHMPKPYNLFEETHRIVKNGGLVEFGSRETDNLMNAWQMAQVVATAHNASMPKENFYVNCPWSEVKEFMQHSSYFEVVAEIEQDETIYVPDTDEGWSDMRNVILSYLDLMRDRSTQRRLASTDVLDFIEGVIRPEYFEPLASIYKGYFPDHVHQGIVVARAIK